MPQDAELGAFGEREEIEELNQKYEHHRANILLFIPPPAALERRGSGLDGLRAETRQAGRNSTRLLRARAYRAYYDDLSVRPKSLATSVCCRTCAFTSLRSTRIRNCHASSARQMVGAMAHPLNQPIFGPEKGGSSGLRHPAAARRREPVQRSPVLVRAPFCRRRRGGSLHPRRFGSISGSFQRRVVRRQGQSMTWKLSHNVVATFPKTRF